MNCYTKTKWDYLSAAMTWLALPVCLHEYFFYSATKAFVVSYLVCGGTWMVTFEIKRHINEKLMDTNREISDLKKMF